MNHEKSLIMVVMDCIICCKTLVTGDALSGSRKSLLHRFLSSVDSHFGSRQDCDETGTANNRLSSTVPGPDETEDEPASCTECAEIMDRFCKLQQDIKSLELELLWRLQKKDQQQKSFSSEGGQIHQKVAKKRTFRKKKLLRTTTLEIRKDLLKKFSQFTLHLSPKLTLQRVEVSSDEKRLGLEQSEADSDDGDAGALVTDKDLEVKMETLTGADHDSDEWEGDLGNDEDPLPGGTVVVSRTHSNSDVDIKPEGHLKPPMKSAVQEQGTEEVRIPEGDDSAHVKITQDRYATRPQSAHRCEVCRKGFSTISPLKAHQRNHHLHESVEEVNQCEDEDDDEEFSPPPKKIRRKKVEAGILGSRESLGIPSPAEKLPKEWLHLKVLENGPTLEEFLSKPTSEMLAHTCNVDACNSQFISEMELEKHSMLHGKFKCNFCPVEENYSPRLAVHEGACPFSKLGDGAEKIFKADKKFKVTRAKCPRCPLKFCLLTAVDYVAHHVETHQGLDMPVLFFCPLCHRQFFHSNSSQFSKDALLRHLLQIHDTSDMDPSGVQMCLKCQPPAPFRKRKQVVAHNAEVHAVQKNCEEPECAGRKFSCLVMHRLHRHGDNPKYFPLSCQHPDCPVRFSTQQTLRSHMTQKHPEWITFSCPDCDEAFDYKYKLEIHKFSHSDDYRPSDKYKFMCPSCFTIIPEYFKFRNHLKQSHNITLHDSNFDPSVLVRKEGKSKLSLASQVKLEEEALAFQCEDKSCSLKFRNSLEMENHKMHHGRFPCESCEEVLTNALDLVLHEQQHSPSASNHDKVTCPRCTSSFEGNYKQVTYVKHFFNKHLLLPWANVICPICQKEYFVEDYAVRHLAVRADHFKNNHDVSNLDPANVAKCDKCPGYFKTSQQLFNHQRFIHKTPLHCESCDRSFPNAATFRQHLLENLDCHDPTKFKIVTRRPRKKKPPGKPHVCEICGKAFHRRPKLERHKNTHGEKSFNYCCEACGKRYQSKSGLVRHMEIHREVQTRFLCTHCGESYAHKASLQHHLKTKHSGMATATDESFDY